MKGPPGRTAVPPAGVDKPPIDRPSTSQVRDAIPVHTRNTRRQYDGSWTACHRGHAECPSRGREHALKPSQPLIAGAAAVATLASIAPAATAATPEETAAKAVDQATQAVAQAQD